MSDADRTRIEGPELLDFVVLFEAEPEWVHPNGWFYGARFNWVRKQDRIVVTIAPDELEFSLDWWQAGVQRIRLRVVRVNGWAIARSPTFEGLDLRVGGEQVSRLSVQLSPTVQIDWEMTW